jgi:hypothetical protein
LHDGGVQDALTDPSPGVDAVTVPTLANTVLVAPVALTAVGLLEFQVSGTPVRVIPRLSVTVALSVVEVFVPTRNDVFEVPKALMEID